MIGETKTHLMHCAFRSKMPKRDEDGDKKRKDGDNVPEKEN